VLGHPTSSETLVQRAGGLQLVLKNIGIKLSHTLFKGKLTSTSGLTWVNVPAGSAGGLVDRVHLVWRQEQGQGPCYGWIDITADEIVMNWGRTPDHDRLN
jgi:hypothetical protein